MATSRTQLGSPRLGSSSGIENRYEYETLEKDDVQRICVLVIDDANDDSSISGTFQLVEIADDPVSSRWAKWDAISYPWEGQDRSESIQINGKPLAVTPNVVAIIKSIRSQRKRLWIDAVCINQEDLTERNHQVQLMRHIYQKASTVVIWLGSNITDAHAWEIHAMADKMGKSPRSGFGTRRYILDSMLTESAWFQRIWEAVLASDLIVRLGTHDIPWFNFSSIIVPLIVDYFGTSEIKSQTIPRGIVAPYHPSNIEMTSYSHTLSILHFIYWLRKWKRCPSISLSPSEIIYRCATAQASIPSDKVHALCALFEVYHINRPVFPICYQLSASDVYQHFTVWCVNQELNLDILARKSIFTGRSHVSMIDLPTWAVDWTSLTISRMQLMEGLMTNDECFSSPYSPSLERMGRQLRVRGLLIDCLESLLGNCLTDASLEEWQALIPDDRENNSLLLEEESPKLTTLRYIFEETSSSDYDIPYLWQQGHSSYGPGGTRTSFRTGRGCVARADEHLADYDDVKICALYGGRSLFLLEPVTDAGLEGTYRLLAGDCYIKGFEDGKGIDMAHNLGLEETDFILI